jgi:trimethylamine--corrinoid protein Co-methyltransferase
MQTYLQVLTQDEQSQVHDRSLAILARTGVRVDSARARRILAAAGAQVDEGSRIVRFPRNLVETSLGLAPKSFTLGARRPGWDKPLNAGDCSLLMDGEGTTVVDGNTGKHRPATFNDWLQATRLADALDDIGIYWRIVQVADKGDSVAGYVDYLVNLFRNFSKHIQDPIYAREQAPWFLEVLQTVFGSKETIRQNHPVSYVLCPQSPLVIDEHYTDAYLELAGWNIPVAVMPMPLMGATAPASLISTVIVANCEVLATLCLVQAAEAGVPIIYAPVSALMDPRTGTLKNDAIEGGLLGAATTEMGRYYGLPVETSGSGSGQFVPNMQSGYERALSALVSVLSWPDILVGAGLVGSAMILSLEQLIIDAEIFRMCRQARRGIVTGTEKWLDDVINRVGPGGHFLDQPTTTRAVRSQEWYINQLGVNLSLEKWQAAGRPDLMAEARSAVDRTLATHQPLPLDEAVDRELDRIRKKAADSLA